MADANAYFVNNDGQVARTITGEQPTAPVISTELMIKYTILVAQAWKS